MAAPERFFFGKGGGGVMIIWLGGLQRNGSGGGALLLLLVFRWGGELFLFCWVCFGSDSASATGSVPGGAWLSLLLLLFLLLLLLFVVILRHNKVKLISKPLF